MSASLELIKGEWLAKPNWMLPNAPHKLLRSWMQILVPQRNLAENRDEWKHMTERYAEELYLCNDFHQSDFRFTRFHRLDLWYTAIDLKLQTTTGHIPVFQFLACDFCQTTYGALPIAQHTFPLGGLHEHPERLMLRLSSGREIVASPRFQPVRSIWEGKTAREIEEVCHRVLPPRRLELVP